MKLHHLFVLLLVFTGSLCYGENSQMMEKRIPLPEPRISGTMSVEEAIKRRRTVRSFTAQAMSLQQLSQLLWAAQGITEPEGFLRASPSAGALYPMEIFLIIGRIVDVNPGIYHYVAGEHAIKLVRDGDHRERLAMAALGQEFIAQAPAVVVIVGDYSRSSPKYGDRGERYVHLEAGHIGQNLFLQAEALGLSAGLVGAFDDEKVLKVLRLEPKSLTPLYIMPFGYKR